ncbi:hypothetical protein DMA11_17085 [Marinilabiliaceae bacterium JC017]|nr:hypothetical protein DMA11_17085 [Marinilabiliaceae bacterium JC017]
MRSVKMLVAAISILLGSCMSLQFPCENTYEKAYLGMSEKEFMNKHLQVKMEYLSSETIIYSIRYNAEDGFGSNGDGTYKKYYYFLHRELIEIDQGQSLINYGLQVPEELM